MQISALEKQAQKVFQELDPNVLSGQALNADVEKAKQRLALQALVDPSLSEARYVGQEKLLQGLQGVGAQPSDEIAALAAQSAQQLSPGLVQLKDRLIDAALSEVEAGASLPPDVQAELVKAGLEQGALVSGTTDPRGMSGNLTRRLIGERALKLQAERQGRAAALAQTAANLEQARTGLLGSLFPNLQRQESGNIGTAGTVLAQSNQMVPEAGLGGADIVNIQSARLGAGTQLAQEQADAAAAAGIAQGNIWNNAIGGATAALTSPDSKIGAGLNSLYGKVFGV